MTDALGPDSRKRESGLWKTFKANLSPFGKVKRLEDSLEAGTPDVIYTLANMRDRRRVMGWVELKQLPAWPVRDSTPVRINHLTLEQVIFAEEWEPHVYMLLGVGREDFALLAPGTVRAIYERRLTSEGVFMESEVFSRGKFPTGEILRCLTRT